MIFMSLSSSAAMAAPQSTDITKPTRERVRSKKGDDKKDKEKKSDDKKSGSKTSDSKPAAASQAKPDTKTPAAKPAEQASQAPKPQPQAAAKSDNDTANKPAQQPKPKVRTTINPDNVQYDGIDISKHQGAINWEELKRYSKIKFVYIKATEGSDYTDPRYRENIHNARKHGFKVGSYHFLSTKSSVVRQFQNFITVAKREEQDLLPIIDVERLSPWTSQQLRDSLKVFADLLEDHYGCKPLIYTSEKFFTKNLGRAFADYPLFIAKYNTVQPNIGGYRWILWQFADNGLFKSAVRGNYGEVDLSRFNKGCSINDILYHPSKHKPKGTSVREAVDHKEKPSSVTMGTEQKPKEAPKPTKRQQEEAKKQAEKDRKAKEREKKLSEQEKKKKEEADKKAREKAEQQKKAAARQKARDDAAKKAAEEKEKAKKAAEEKAKKQAEEKAKRKASAQQARQQKAQRQASGNKTSKSASLLGTSGSKLSQSQKNDSIRNARNQGRKTNKSSADND
ncbi:MAG: hypothetical protein IJV05_10255 [Muribaculaceae bacterium]|nr:hypothetical protein [Muribaculaceae bacterium]